MENFTAFFVFMSFVLGAIIGSFLNVVILRMPKEQKLTGRSHCRSCGKNLGIVDLIPIFSYLFLLGKCRNCGHKISPRYFIIELLVGLLFAFCCWTVNPANSQQFILLAKDFLVCALLVVVFVIDLEHFLILDSVVFFGITAACLFNLALDIFGHTAIFSLSGHLLNGLLAAVIAALPFFAVWYFSKGKWMGFGDVKLALFLGTALGLGGVFVGLMLAVLLGGLVSVFLLIFTKNTLKSQIPFGTFLSFGAILALFYGDKLLHWYLAFLGF